jgi:hypothetical protein
MICFRSKEMLLTIQRFKHFIRRIALLPLWALVCSGILFAQTPATTASSKSQLKVPVWVEDAEGQFWLEGKRQSFKVFLDEQEVALKNLQGPTSGTMLLVVFDTVVDLTRIELARTAVTEALKNLPENHWVGLLTAQDGLNVLQEPTATRALLAEKIAALQANGRAGLLDTLEPVARLATSMQQKANVRVSVLYVTDTGVANYRADMLNPVVNSSDTGDLSRRFADRAVQERMSRMAQDLSAFTIPLFVLHLEYRPDTLNLAYQSGLERIAHESGGAAQFCRTNDEIAPALEMLLKRLRSGYVLTFDAPKRKRATAKLRVSVIGTDNQPFERVKHADQLTLPRP